MKNPAQFANVKMRAAGLRPDETIPLQPFGQQAQTIAASPQQFDDVAAPATQHKHMPIERIWLQRRLDLGRQAVGNRSAWR